MPILLTPATICFDYPHNRSLGEVAAQPRRTAHSFRSCILVRYYIHSYFLGQTAMRTVAELKEMERKLC